MEAAPPVRRAGVLSSFDLPDAGQLLVHGCEDCSCAVSGDQHVAGTGTLPQPATVPGSWVAGSEVVEIALDQEHHALFNPLGHGGVVVVNSAARRLFHQFRHPTDVSATQAAWPSGSDEVERTVCRLVALDLLHRPGQPFQPRFQASSVLTAWLHVSNACNLRCPYCYVSKSNVHMDEATGRAAVEAVVRSAVEHGFHTVKLKYAGGEASLNYRLMLALHAHAEALVAQHSLQLQATLLSNGVSLPQRLIEALKAHGIRVMISLDGIGAQHDAQRPFVDGRRSFQFVERTILRLIEDRYAPHLSITITNRNLSGVAEVVRFALERGLTFSLNLFRDNDCAAGFADLRYQEQAMIAALLQAFRVIEDHMPRWSVLGSILDRGQLLQPRQRPCGVGQDYVVIDQAGQVAKCHMEIERTLGEIARDDPLRLVRQDTATVLNLPVEEKAGCRDCTWRYWCSGGCPVATFRATGRYDIKSPNCNIYKAIYPPALRLEGLRLLRYAGSVIR